MKILYDSQIFSLQKYGGISRYFYELINEFSYESDIDIELAIHQTENIYIKNSTLFSAEIKNVFINQEEKLEKTIVNKTKGFAKRIVLSNKFLTKSASFIMRNFNIFQQSQNPIYEYNLKSAINTLNKGEFNLFHPTYYDPYFLEYLHGKPFVLTVYDMIHEKYSQIYPDYNNVTIKWKKILIEKASMIIAISENTKKDILKFYNSIPENKVAVVYLGVSLNPNRIKEFPEFKIPERYFLFVGDRFYYKNFEFFIKSAAELLKKDTSLNVVCAGGHVFTNEEKKLITDLGIEEQIFHYPLIKDSLLVHFYSNALAFVFPSLYEGFGIPILESFACGCPAVLSRSSSFLEVAQDAALYFNAQNCEELKHVLKQIIYNTELRENLKKKGFERLKHFSCRRCAEETKRVYQTLIS